MSYKSVDEKNDRDLKLHFLKLKKCDICSVFLLELQQLGLNGANMIQTNLIFTCIMISLVTWNNFSKITPFVINIFQSFNEIVLFIVNGLTIINEKVQCTHSDPFQHTI